ncbi:hypothetical protein HDZ31DRAFT_70559 [Schizophyllum fasciatum]
MAATSRTTRIRDARGVTWHEGLSVSPQAVALPVTPTPPSPSPLPLPLQTRPPSAVFGMLVTPRL